MDGKDILIEVDESFWIGARLHLINKSAPTVLFFHGNGEIASDYDEISQIYNQKKINFIIADYRGYGLSNGIPDIKNIQSDAHIILDYILKYLKEGNYSGSLFLMGRSLGSVSVLELTKRYPNDFSGLVIESGFAEEEPFFELMGTTSEKVGFKKEDGFLNGEKIKTYNGPLLIIHADQDHIVPFNQGKLLYLTCCSENKKLLVIPNANHNNLLEMGFQQYLYEIEIFINP